MYCRAECELLLHDIVLPEKTSLSSLHAGFTYSKVLHSLLHALKYPGYPEIAEFCAELLFQHLTVPNVTCVTWVPIDPARLTVRGFNQTEAIARAYAKLVGVPARETLRKHQSTPQQVRMLSRSAREANLKGSISVTLATALSPPPTVLLIDDVCTTGATLEVCAQALLASGVTAVHGVAVAHGQ